MKRQSSFTAVSSKPKLVSLTFSKRYRVQVCVVSGQATPNYIPIVHPDFQPEIIVLLISGKMKDNAQYLQTIVRKNYPKMQIITEFIDDDCGESEEGITALKAKVTKIISALNVTPDEVGVNITGGTKLMTLALAEIVREEGYEAFYFTLGKNDVLLLSDFNKYHFVPEKLSIEDYLYLHGYKVAKPAIRETSDKAQALFEQLGSRNRGALSKFYSLFQTGNQNQYRFDLSQAVLLQSDIKILNIFKNFHLLEFEDDIVTFANAEDRDFVTGGWFEEYVFSIIKEREGIQDCAMNIAIIPVEQEDVDKHKNEIDVAYMKNNKLYVVECKTRNYTSKQSRAEGNNDLYKLETLQKLGGLQTEKVFISFQDVTEAMRERADFARIELIQLHRDSDLEYELEKKHLI